MSAVIRFGFAGVVLAGLGLAAVAQTPKGEKSLLDEALRERELVTQKVEADLKATLEKARAAGSAEAVGLLKKALADIEANTVISEARKTALTRMLQDRIRITELAAKTEGSKPTVAPSIERNEKANARRAELQNQEDERVKVKAGVEAINKLLGQKRTDEAERQANALAADYPNNSAARVMGQKAFINSRIRQAKDLLADQEARLKIAMDDVTRSSVPSKGDVEFDREIWKRGEKRNKDNLSAKEKAILKALTQMVQPDWKGSQLQNVITELSTLTGQTILIDKKALEDAVIGTDAAVNFVAPREVSVRTALRRVLGDVGLAYVIRDESIYVTTTQKARDMMTTRVYPLGDLVTGNALTTPPPLLEKQEAQVVETIIGMIKKSIDPMSWDTDGGRASIHYNAITKALIVRQSAEVHMRLGGSLSR